MAIATCAFAREPTEAHAAARKYLAEQMDAYFFGAGADVAAGDVKPGGK